MSPSLKAWFDSELGFVRTEMVGEVTGDDLLVETDKVAALADEHSCDRFLIDYRRARVRFSLVDLYRDSQSQNRKSIDKATVKIALLKPSDPAVVGIVRFYDALAMVSGWNARVFDEIQDAIAWLQR